MEGTVLDKSGAAVAGATVTVTNEATGVSRDTVTGDSGFYRVPGLTPGIYKVDVEASTFKKQTTPNVVVAAEATKGLNITLEPGLARENVTVNETVTDLQTENANITGTISSQRIVNLPEFGLDPYELLRLTPGVFADSARQGNGNSQAIPQQVGPGGSNSQIFQTENQVQAIADGQRVSANNFILDGVSVNSLEWGGASVITPNQESVDEVSVSSNSYSAQDGRNSGAQVKVISKSGANDWHGSAFVKFNDKGLNSFNKFYGPTNVSLSPIICENGTPSQFTITASHCPTRVDQRYRDYAGSFGGPLIKNKLFFFFSYEGVRLSNTTTIRDKTLETPQFEQYVVQNNPGSIAAKLFSTPGIAPRISSVVSETDCCSLIPGYGIGKWYVAGNGPGQAIGNGPDGIPDWGIFDLTVPNSSTGNQYNGRMDYTQGNNQFFVSTYIVRLNNFNGGQRPIQDTTLQPHNYAATIGWTRTFGPAMLNEFRVNFTRYDFDQRQPVGLTNYGIPQYELFDFDISAGKSIGFGENDNLIGIGQGSTTPGALAQNTYGLAETFSWIRGRHAWKFGVEARREQNNNNQSGDVRPQYKFRGLLNLANDACCFAYQVGVNPTGGTLNGQRYFRTGDYALFAQDDWKASPTLTLNLGLRWEYFAPLTELNNTMSNYVFGSQGVINGYVCGPVAPLTPCRNGSQLYSPDRNNFGPRVGFAWSPSRYAGKVVFRGGFGVVFNRNADVIFDNIRQNTPFSALVQICPPNCYFDPGPIVGTPPGSNIIYSLGSSSQANSYPINGAFANGVAPDGALCANAGCTSVAAVQLFGALPSEPNPYVYIFSYQTEVEPVKDLVVKLGYQGSRSRKLVRTIDMNRFIPGDTFDGTQDKFQNDGSNGQPCGATNSTCLAPHPTGNPRFSGLLIPLPNVNASYDALVASVSRRFNHGFQVDANYTW
ncbi:MAG: TonB-dependent receptor domain-containing protein, partial [Terriglobales bacterium]